MKKLFPILLTLLLSFVLFSCNEAPPAETEAPAPLIGEEQALAIAMDMATGSKEDADSFYNTAVEYRSEEGFYVVTFENNLESHAYEISGTSGKILRGKRRGKPQTMPAISAAIPNATTPPEPAETTAE